MINLNYFTDREQEPAATETPGTKGGAVREEPWEDGLFDGVPEDGGEDGTLTDPSWLPNDGEEDVTDFEPDGTEERDEADFDGEDPGTDEADFDEEEPETDPEEEDAETAGTPDEDATENAPEETEEEEEHGDEAPVRTAQKDGADEGRGADRAGHAEQGTAAHGAAEVTGPEDEANAPAKTTRKRNGKTAAATSGTRKEAKPAEAARADTENESGGKKTASGRRTRSTTERAAGESQAKAAGPAKTEAPEPSAEPAQRPRPAGVVIRTAKSTSRGSAASPARKAPAADGCRNEFDFCGNVVSIRGRGAGNDVSAGCSFRLACPVIMVMRHDGKFVNEIRETYPTVTVTRRTVFADGDRNLKPGEHMRVKGYIQSFMRMDERTGGTTETLVLQAESVERIPSKMEAAFGTKGIFNTEAFNNVYLDGRVDGITRRGRQTVQIQLSVTGERSGRVTVYSHRVNPSFFDGVQFGSRLQIYGMVQTADKQPEHRQGSYQEILALDIAKA